MRTEILLGRKLLMKTTTVAVLGSVAINAALGLLVAAVFSVTPVAHAREIAQCPDQKPAEAVVSPEHERAGGHLAAVRMGWEAS
jgi:hypothetical protein